MTSARTSRVAVWGVVLLLAGIVLAAMFRLVSGTEHHAYSPAGGPPTAQRVHAGQTYQLAVRGGVQAALERGVGQLPGQDGAVARLALRCTWSVNGTAAQDLTLRAETVDTKAVNTIATFTAPISGMLRVRCAGWGPVYIGGTGSGDPAGWLLIAAIIALTVGGGLGLSALRAGSLRRRDLPSPAPPTRTP